MRELKFRAWGNRQNKYLNPDDVSIRADGFITIFNVDGKHSRAVQPPGDLLSPWFIIEQYTGLNDKNGTEIYEGDILIDDTGEPVEYWVVKFSEGGFVGECAGVAEPLFELTNLEVVGNIHEDSELLEEK